MSAGLLDVKNADIMLGNFPLGGFGANEAMTVEFTDALIDHMISCDGQVAISRINDKRMMVGLTFLQTSGSIPLVEDLLAAQTGRRAARGPAVILPLPFFYQHPPTGCFINSPFCIFTNRITPGIGRNAQEVQYQFLLPDPVYEWGRANVNFLARP